MRKTVSKSKTGGKPAAVRRAKTQAAPARRGGIASPASLGLARAVVGIIEDKQGVNPVIVDVRGRSSVTDYFVVVSGMNSPHLRAMSEEIQARLKKQGTRCYRRSETPESGWLVLDYVDVVIHMLLDQSRKHYAIEDLWNRRPPPE